MLIWYVVMHWDRHVRISNVVMGNLILGESLQPLGQDSIITCLLVHGPRGVTHSLSRTHSARNLT